MLVILIAILAIILMVIAVRYTWKEENKYGERDIVGFILESVWNIFLLIFLALITITATTIIYITITKTAYIKNLPDEEIKKTKIIALKSSESIHGSFFLTSGEINGKSYFSFYENLPNGGKILNRIDAQNVVIYEESRTDAYIAQVQNNKLIDVNNISGWVVPSLLVESFLGAETDHQIHKIAGYAIHVPKGTIKTQNSL